MIPAAQSESFTIMTFNAQNLFDTKDDEGKDDKAYLSPCGDTACISRPEFCHQEVIKRFVKRSTYEPMIIGVLARRLHAYLDSSAIESHNGFGHAKYQEVGDSRLMSGLYYEVQMPSIAFVTRPANKVETLTELAKQCRRKEKKGLVDKNCIKSYMKISALSDQLEEFSRKHPGRMSKDMICHAMCLTSIKNDEVLQTWFVKNYGKNYEKLLPTVEAELNAILLRAFEEIEEMEFDNEGELIEKSSKKSSNDSKATSESEETVSSEHEEPVEAAAENG